MKILERRPSELLFESDFETNSNLNRISMKANAFYSHYKSRAIHQYKNKYIVA
jgi:hypothetical protein